MGFTLSNKLKVLITNDDGIDAEGIRVLAEKVGKVAEVYVLAPDSNRSAVSSHIIMNKDIVFTQCAKNFYACSAYPADCVIAAFKSSIFGDIHFDAVLSGINRGPNMGTDYIYSGTVAAARQAVLYGVPGIAFSLKSNTEEYDYVPLAEFAAKNLEKLISLWREGLVLSVNASSNKKIEKAKLTSLCIRDYRDKVDISYSEQGTLHGTFCGGNISTSGSEENEYEAVKKGFVAVTRFYAEPVGYCGNKDEKLDFVF